MVDKIQAAMNGVSQVMEWAIVRHDGTTLDGELSLSRGVMHGTACLQVSIRDISERKKAKDALQESEARYKTLFETANDAIVILNGEIFSDCNPQTEALLGCGKDKIVGRTPLDFAPQKQHDGRLSSEVLARSCRLQ